MSTLTVGVSIDTTGAPFALRATQRLDVRRIGDYFFTIGAPISRVATAAGSTADPGLRAGAYLWQGFNPGRRILAASVELGLAAAAALPLRIEVADGRVRLTNATAVRAAAYAADGNPAQLRAYLGALRAAAARGEPATGGGTSVTSAPQRVRMLISALLEIEGTIGAQAVRLDARRQRTTRERDVSHRPGQAHCAAAPSARAPRPAGRRVGSRPVRTRDTRLARIGAFAAVRHVPRQPGPSRAEQCDVPLPERESATAGRRTRRAVTGAPGLDAPADRRRGSARRRRRSRGRLG